MTQKEYPYYIVPAIDALASASGEERVRLVRRIAAAVGDPVALRAIIGADPEEFLSFYPDMQSPELSTSDTIDAFLDRFGSPTVSAKSAKLPGPAAIPYDLSSLEALPELPEASPLFPETEPSPKLPEPSAPSMSESLARIMIKNGNYQKALEIITEISLNNPKKSIYFADQIRFLEKLIALKVTPKAQGNN